MTCRETTKLLRSYGWDPDCRPCADLCPAWATGVCWCAVKGQQGTLLLRPLRSHLGNSWAEGRRLPGSGKLTHPQCRPVPTSRARPPPPVHVCIRRALQRYRLGNKQSELFEARTPARPRLPTEAEFWLFQREVLPCSRARPRGGWAAPLAPPWVIFCRTAPLSKGCERGVDACWVPVTCTYDAICVPFPPSAPITTLPWSVLCFEWMKACTLHPEELSCYARTKMKDIASRSSV